METKMTKANEILGQKARLRLEWSVQYKDHQSPVVASLTERGVLLSNYSTTCLKPSDALELGKWLVEMYSEREA